MKYPIGIQSFEKLRRGNYVYVDKSAMLHELAQLESCFFLSRPRRFGKSLMLSTLEAYFKGQRELFEGLKICNLEKEWIEYPVLHIDLNSRQYQDEYSLLAELNKHLELMETIYGDTYKDRAPEERFSHIIELAYKQTNKPVVVLIDEYDKPLLQTADNAELQAKMRAILKSLYSVLKTQDKYIRFAMLTGVTKFSKVSVFSDLNNLVDISMYHKYQAICGVTESELHDVFDTSVAELADANKIGIPTAYAKLKENYDGYHFVEDGEDIYNPFSLLNVFESKRFDSYWFESGTPTFLAQLLKKNNVVLSQIDGKETDSSSLRSVDTMLADPIPVLYQSGYLTIKGYSADTELYTLGFPNKEVEQGFMRFLVPYYTNIQASDVVFNINGFCQEWNRK